MIDLEWLSAVGRTTVVPFFGPPCTMVKLLYADQVVRKTSERPEEDESATNLG